MNQTAATTAPHIAPAQMSAASSDDVLRAALRQQPWLPKSTFAEASACHHRLIQNPHFPAVELGVSEYWHRESLRYTTAVPREQTGMVTDQAAYEAAAVKALRIALDMRDALRDLAADIPLLTHADMLSLRNQIMSQNAPAMLEAVWNRGPGLRAWQARRRAAAEAGQAIIERERERQTAAYEVQAKAARGAAAKTLLRRLAVDGVHVTAAKGNLTAHPAALLTDAHRTALREFRGELVSILAAPPEVIPEQLAAA